MNDCDPEWMEAELRRLKPARLPQELIDRLASARLLATVRPEVLRRSTLRPNTGWRQGSWLVPVTAAAVVMVVLLLWPGPRFQGTSRGGPAAASALSVFKAADVEIGQQLIATFDTVAQMPDGQPVRFRCREWMDEVVLRDSAFGVEIEQRTPRFEVVPVSYETY